MTFIPRIGPQTVFEADFATWTSGVTDFVSAGDGSHTISDGTYSISVDTGGANRASTFDIDGTEGIRIIHSGSNTSNGVLSAENATTGSPRISFSMVDLLPEWALNRTVEIWVRTTMSVHTSGTQSLGFYMGTTPWSTTNNENIAMGIAPGYYAGNNQVDLIQRTEGSNTSDIASAGTDFTTNSCVVMVAEGQQSGVQVYGGSFSSDWPALSALDFWGSLAIPTNEGKVWDTRPTADKFGLMMGVACNATASVNTYKYIRQLRVRL